MTDAPAITCHRVLTLLLEYVEGELDPVMHAAMALHLGDCPACDHFLAQYKQASAVCREALSREMPAELRERMVSFVRTHAE